MKIPKESHILLEKHMTELGIKFKPEYQFYDNRKWRFDYLINGPDWIYGVEIEGAIWTRGRHTRGKGYQADMEKYNHASVLGFRLLRFSTAQVLDGTAREFLKKWCCE